MPLKPKKSKPRNNDIPEKFDLTYYDLIMLERASNLKVTDEFEDNFIADIKLRYRQYGMKTQITHKQRIQLESLSSRYLSAIGQ
jgi:hypothetical protein